MYSLMGKKNKDKSKVSKEPCPYTESERNKKILCLTLQMTGIHMDHVLTPEIKQNMNNFIKTGEPYNVIVKLPEYSREMEINLVNDRNQSSHIKFKFIKIRIPDEGDNNPINQLNKIQEEII